FSRNKVRGLTSAPTRFMKVLPEGFPFVARSVALPEKFAVVLLCQKMFDHQLVQRLIITIPNQLSGGRFVEGADFLQQKKKSPSAVRQMVEPALDFCGS